ncbi:DUF805 domain-containing protein [Acidaminococcus sp. LBK-2]|uniref:DUF805 domain-containing protein n=1 Tax=Acidaminococcus sp. LBK-2 TaxID=3456956 RepID=UPI003FA4B629
MKTCPKCHKIYEDSQNFCSECGTQLVLTPVSQALRGNGNDGEKPEETAAPTQENNGGKGTQELGNGQQGNNWQQYQQQQPYQSQQTQQNPYGPGNNASFGARFQANIPDANTWKPMYFSFEGRLSRGTYVYRWLILLLSAVVIGLISGIISFLAPLGMVALIALAVSQISLAVRRLHDRGHSGLWLLVCVVPALNLLMFIYLLFAQGQPGQNEYGMEE